MTSLLAIFASDFAFHSNTKNKRTIKSFMIKKLLTMKKAEIIALLFESISATYERAVADEERAS